MPEIQQLRTGDTISYSGPFSLSGVRRVIDGWFDRYDYDRDKVLDEEIVSRTGKQCTVVFEAKKGMNDYADMVIEVTLSIENMKDIVVEVDGRDMDVKDGDIEISITSFLKTDTAGKYDASPLTYFFRFIAEKWFYSSYIDKWAATVHDHRRALKRDINEYLNKEIV